ncbi:MAG: ABC transporter permease subunit [Chloroflexi bacterium]|nr:ABC transporter permease subunit [Chloroflexota bacterium]
MTARLRNRSHALQALAGFVLLGVAWEIAGQTRLLGPSWPPLSRVAAALTSPTNFGLFQRGLSATLGEALLGYVIGIGLAAVSAMLCMLVPRLYAPIYRLSAILTAIPIVAVAGLLVSVLPREACPVAVAILAVYFTGFVAILAGFESASPVHQDLLTVLGATRQVRFFRLQAPAALPALVDGLKLGAPAAVLGAIVGEWFGAERGLGPLLVSSMQNYRIDIMWSAALLGAGVSMLVYGLLGVVERRVAADFR